jgi:hypothetical protein
MAIPEICKHCGKEHATQEELEQRGNEGSTDVDPKPLPHDIATGEAPETISEEYAPKRRKSNK